MSMLNRIQEIVNIKDGIIGSLESELAEKDRVVKESGQTIEAQKQQIVSIQKDLDINIKQVSKWKTACQEKKEKLKLSEEEAERLEVKVQHLGEENASLKKVAEEARKTESSLTNQIKKLERQLTAKSNEILELTNFISALESELPPKKNR